MTRPSRPASFALRIVRATLLIRVTLVILSEPLPNQLRVGQRLADVPARDEGLCLFPGWNRLRQEPAGAQCVAQRKFGALGRSSVEVQCPQKGARAAKAHRIGKLNEQFSVRR